MVWLLLLSLNFISCKKDSAEVPLADAPNFSASQIADTTSLASTSFSQAGNVKFFDAGLDDRGCLSAYNKTNTAFTSMIINPDLIKVVGDPVYGAKRKVMLMDVKPDQTGNVTNNPRAQVQTPMQYTEGQDVWIGFSVYFPKTIWTYFLTFSELYGAPYKGSSPFRLGIQESNIIIDYNGGTKWRKPMKAGVWYDFVYHEVLSQDATVGKAQVYLREQGNAKYTEILPLTNMPTITAANFAGPQYHKLACYYDRTHTFTDATRKTNVDRVQVYFANHKVGNSFKQVAPANLDN
ncbi:heparin lyase I family protein [Mucilaginibacter lacusdianchii]|uniref:heparin lyase I family protein n=1 Tax=Mucilaginibacter lacusdianchii TaxID=2684211 RepID=UPI00131E0317|nr:heparin lyase I family protein [Mucilaginibacter sp. JXJ CY 39]